MPPGGSATGSGKYTKLVQDALQGSGKVHDNASSDSVPDSVCPSSGTPSTAVVSTRKPTDEVGVTLSETHREDVKASLSDLDDDAKDGTDELVNDEVDDDDDDGDEEDEEQVAQTGEDHHAPLRFSCDACPHLLFATPDDLVAHARAHHQSTFPDYDALHTIASKLSPHWAELKARKQDTIRAWGRKIFHVAATRDAGAEKMGEAHKAREQLELVVRRWQPGAKVFMFGSAVSFAVWDGMSDIDFAVVDVDAFEAGRWPPLERNAVRSTTELLRRAGFSFANIEPISHARVPIIKHHASAPIRLAGRPVVRRPARARSRGSGDDATMTTTTAEGQEADVADTATVLEAEHVVARSVRFLLSQPATREDRISLEGSVRHAVECVADSSPSSSAAPPPGAVQQVWWNRTADVMSVTCDSTTSAMRAATAVLSFATPSLRAKVQPLHDECRPELFNVDFDLSFRAFGIRNSLLLRRYLTSHPCARPGAIVLKDWSKTSGVNNSVNGYLTSYAINIMWIYFLVQRGVVPYVDPHKDIPAALRAEPGVEQDPYLRDGFPDYIPFIPVDGATALSHPGRTESAEALAALYAEAGELLMDFFHFYAFEFDWSNHVVSLNRPGLTTKRALGWAHEDVTAAVSGAGGGRRGHGVTRYAFCIEDPYEPNLNLGRHMGVTKFLKVKAELYRAFLSLLKDGVTESCVFAATDAAELRRRVAGGGGGDGTAAPGTITASSPPPEGNAVPDRLPLRVLYRLTAAALQTLAGYTMKQPTQASPSGIPSHLLEKALRRQHPADLALALKVWNWQQLVHRFGLKELHGTVYPRREVGARRLPVSQPQSSDRSPSTAHAEDSTDAEPLTSSAAQANRQVPATRQPVRTSDMAEHVMAALTNPQSYLALRPAWVAWSTPWATLKARTAACAAVGRPPTSAGTSASTGLFASTRPQGMAPRGWTAHGWGFRAPSRPLLRAALESVLRI